MESQESQVDRKYMKIGEASSLLGVSTQTLRDWIEKGLIGCTVLPSGHRRFLSNEVMNLVKNGFEEIDEIPPGAMGCNCGYWYENGDEEEMIKKGKEARWEVWKIYKDRVEKLRENEDKWRESNEFERMVNKKILEFLFEKHLVPFREIMFKKTNTLNPNYTSERATTRMYACPSCGTLKVEEGIDFFFEPRRARQKHEEEVRMRREYSRYGSDRW